MSTMTDGYNDKQTGTADPPDAGSEWVNGSNGRSAAPEDLTLPSPTPRYRHCSGSTTPTRTPTPTREGVGFPRSADENEHAPVTKTKSVSFHSHTNWKSDRRIQNAQDCLQYMMEGTSMIKLRSNGRQYHRYFRLLEDLSAITWAPSSKKSSRAQVPIEQMKEIRTGRHCESLRNKHFPAYYNEERIFSILYGSAYDSLDLIACTPGEANIWVSGLNALIGASQSPESVEDTQTLRESWLRDNFVQATRDSNGYIDQTTCIELIKKLDQQVATDKVKQKIQEFDHEKADQCRGRIELDEFIDMFKEVATRPEIYFLLIRYANKDNLTREDFHLFLEGEQGMCGLTEEKVSEMILKYEPAPEARKCGQLLIDGFTKYLLSEECDIFDPIHREVCQDMTQPLSHYFISTSHNTYLLEDQLKGPSSVDGYIRVLSCGCRCVKVDVWDGVDEPLVYHGNTLTSKVPFRDVMDAIASYSFDYSIYPVFVHLENHCSIRQQKIMAELIKTILGKYLYVHPKDSPKKLCDLSPEDLKFKIILKGKKLAGNEPEGEVTDEDEGGETKRNNNPRKIKLCREFSSLISMSRSRSLEIPTASNKENSNTMWSVSESTMGKLCHSKPEELAQHNKSCVTRIFPNSSRVDSSNYNPQDFWNVGCQMVALNFQTPGQMMDVYEGKFRANGACGYILKPNVMREHISIFSTNSKDSIPGVAPQILKIKVISGQCLPKPSGSTAVKASVIDPYVVIQIFGIPSDCAEDKTRTISNDCSSPIFDECFDFLINLPELALVRFVVLDDEFIGDDFIGQCTIPFDCLQTGYRHIRLLSSMGEPIPNATLFVHVSISNKRGGKNHKGWGKKKQKNRVNIKTLGLKVADDIFKESLPLLTDAELRQEAVESAWAEVQEECGLGHTANIKQCLKVVISRFTAQPDCHNLSIVTENEIPFLRTSRPEPLPSHLHKLTSALDRLLIEMHQFQTETPAMKLGLTKQLEPSLKLYDELESLMTSHGIKGKKANKCRENFAFNVRMIRGQLDRLESLEKRCKVAFDQMDSTNVTLKTLNMRDRSPSVRDRSRLNPQNRLNTSESLSSDSLGRSSISTSTLEGKPKSILKKSNSNIESNSQGYVEQEPSPDSPHGLLKPPLHHSLSYTPGITAKCSYDPPLVEPYLDESPDDSALCFTAKPQQATSRFEPRCNSLEKTYSASSHTYSVDLDDPSTAL